MVSCTPPLSWPPSRRVRVKVWVPVPLLTMFQLTAPWVASRPAFMAAAYWESSTIREVTLVMSAVPMVRVWPLVSTVRFRLRPLMLSLPSRVKLAWPLSRAAWALEYQVPLVLVPVTTPPVTCS